jgi:glyoxylase-like metal-dependent hydrolase (beta-lactamase superfamily II)
MAGPAIAFNQPGLDQQLPAHIRDLEVQRATARDSASIDAHLARDRFFLEQKRSVRHVLPTITYSDSLTMYLGRRVVQLRHHDRAITPGDTYLWLPDERVLVLGDLLINPVTYALFCYPSGWIATLDALDAMDAAVLVPGHGAPMRDERLLHATRALLVRERALATGARARGLTVDQAKAELLADSTVRTLRAIITGGDARLNESFALYLVDWFVRRVYQELDGTLDDTIPRLP